MNCQTPLSMGFLSQEHRSGLPFPSPGDLPDPGIKPMSPESSALASGFFTIEPPVKPNTQTAAAAKSLQSCPTLSDPMDCSLLGPSIHGVFQARLLEWDAIAFSG